MKGKMNLKNKKFIKKNILLTVVALIEIILIMMMSSAAWIETVSSIKIFTPPADGQGEVGTKGIIETALKQRATVNTTGSDIDLTGYFRPSGGYHLTAASSANGEDVLFPEARGSSGGSYRIATISDKNVNYVSFTFKVTNAVNLAFDQVPTIKINGTAITNNLVRFSIGYAASASAQPEFNIYGMQKNSDNETAVAEADGSTRQTTVRKFLDYTKGHNKVLTTAANSFVTVNMWIQDPTFANYSTYHGKAITVENFKLVPVTKFTAKAVYGTTPGSTGGTVAINDTDFGATAEVYVASGQSITLKAAPSATNGYDLIGWATSSSGSPMSGYSKSEIGSPTGGVYSKTYTVGSTYTLYARFSDEHTLYLRTTYHHETACSYYAYVWGNINGTLVKTWYKMTEQSTDYYKCSYKGNANSVIFCYMDPNTPSASKLNGYTGNQAWDNYRWLQTYDLQFPLDVGEYIYKVTSRKTPYSSYGKVFGYWEHSFTYAKAAKCTDSASSNSANSVDNPYLSDAYSNHAENTRYSGNPLALDGTQYKANSSDTTYEYQAKVHLKANPGTAYNFVGWYDNADGTGTALSTSASCDLQALANASGGSPNKIFYAKFAEKPESWQLKYGASGGSNWTALTLNSQGNNVYKKTMDLTEGQAFNFKIYDAKRDKWYSNGTTYDGYITTTILNAETLYDSTGADMYLRGHKGTYTFSFNSSTKKLTVTVSFANITITFDTSSTQWVGDASAIVWFDTAQGSKQMTKNSNSNWTVSVPSNYCGSTSFKRNNPGNTATWNTWNAGYRNDFKTTYKTTGDGTGGWQ